MTQIEVVLKQNLSPPVADRSAVSTLAFLNPWFVSFDEDASAITLENRSVEILRQVQIYAAAVGASFKSLPVRVAPLESASFFIGELIESEGVNVSMFVRWVDPLKNQLVWPIAW